VAAGTVPSIGDYGLIGDTRTAALVSSAGSVDWMCFPRFDSVPLFGRLVGGEGAGRFAIEMDEVCETNRRYLDGSAIVETTWVTATGEGRLLEGMVVDTDASLLPQSLVVRTLSCREGSVRGSVIFDPKLDWTRPPARSRRRHGMLFCTWGSIVATVASRPDLSIEPGRPSAFSLKSGQSLTIVLGLDHREPAVLVDPEHARTDLYRTDAWWRGWTAGLHSVAEDTDEAVRRSLLTLRLLTYAPSGAPVAAPTTSLPEVAGGDANWDYRFAWIRDASMQVAAFLNADSFDEARAFLWWMLHASRRTTPELRVLYDVMGGEDLPERELWDLPGYRGARPVRIGNAAAKQFQLDVYGWMIDAGWGHLRETGELYRETWRELRGHADLLADRWHEPDNGIWELRGGRRHYVHSKAMAWIGLDRALRIGQRLGMSERRRQRWLDARDAVADAVRRLGFNEDIGSYTQSFGSRELDAAVLAMPIARIEPRDSPRLVGTIEAIARELDAGYPLLYRFDPTAEGAFIPCSFWWSRALTETGRVEEGRDVFQTTCGLATDLGLFAEEIDPTTREHTGNFPQAFTHAALVEAAAALGRAESVRATGTSRGSLRT
jgi:GH15 family glucan-1,4-alpha-glucosidase